MSAAVDAPPAAAPRARSDGRARPRHAAPADWWGRAGHVVLAAVAYTPLLLTAPGQVAADTKQYLYLDPGRLLSRAASMWGGTSSTGIGGAGRWLWTRPTVAPAPPRPRTTATPRPWASRA